MILTNNQSHHLVSYLVTQCLKARTTFSPINGRLQMALS